MKYIVELAFLVIMLVYSIVLGVFYSSRKRLESDDTKTFSAMIITNIFSVFLKICSIFSLNTLGEDNFLSIILVKLSLAFFLVFVLLLSLYAVGIVRIKKNANYEIERETTYYMKYFLVFIFAAATICMLFLNIKFLSSEGSIYPSGDCVNLVYLVTLVTIFLTVMYVLLNSKNANKKQFLPIVLFVLSAGVITVIEIYFPEIILTTSIETFVIFLMYHTVEDPDNRTIEQLEREKEVAVESNRNKSDFITSMSHEIRTPLNVILGLSEDMEKYEKDLPIQVKEDCDDVINASQSLLETVNNILNINEIESDTIKITKEAYNFKEDMEMLAKVYSIRVKEKTIEFKYRISDEIPYELIGDRIHVKQVVNNILSNAFKYTNEGEINLNIGCINQGGVCDLIITVKDTGIGMRPEKVAKIFDKVDRIELNKKTTTQGTKVGLAITKKLVEMMGGKINLESQYGKGTTFMVTLSQKINYATKEAANAKESDNKESFDTYGSKRILIVDDNKLNIKVVKRALSDYNFILEEVYDGKQAVDKVRENNNYDLILMDIMMPVMNGEEALFELKKDENFKTPVIALTADAISGSKEHYKEVGFDDYLSKPFTKEQMKEKLDIRFK